MAESHNIHFLTALIVRLMGERQLKGNLALPIILISLKANLTKYLKTANLSRQILKTYHIGLDLLQK